MKKFIVTLAFASLTLAFATPSVHAQVPAKKAPLDLYHAFFHIVGAPLDAAEYVTGKASHILGVADYYVDEANGENPPELVALKAQKKAAKAAKKAAKLAAKNASKYQSNRTH